MRKVYHDYRRWEDYKNGMWRSITKDEAEKLLPVAIEFTSNHIEYGKAMMKAIKSWPFSCEHNLTDSSLNKRAWVGHAACSLEKNLPESIVRSAWKFLTDEQRHLANQQADNAIQEFFNKKSGQLSIW